MRRTTKLVVLLLTTLFLVFAASPSIAQADSGKPDTNEIYFDSGNDPTNDMPYASYLNNNSYPGLSYNASSGVLTLNNYDGPLIGYWHKDGPEEASLTIVLKGQNHIRSFHGSIFAGLAFQQLDRLTITSSSGGSLSIHQAYLIDNPSMASIGIVGGESITISGNATVNVNVTRATYGSVTGISVSNYLNVIDDASLTILCTGGNKVTNCNGISMGGYSPQQFRVTSSKPVTIDLSECTGCTYGSCGANLQHSSQPLSFMNTPQVAIFADKPIYYVNDKELTVEGYTLTQSPGHYIWKPTVKPDPPSPGDTVPIYRMYNTKTSEHLYTTNATEYNSCGSGNYVDWNAEGVAWQAPKPGASGAKPVYRLYNLKSGDHHYTTSVGERDTLLASGDWRDEGTAFWSGGPVEVYRLYNGRLKRGQHHYTTSAGERDALVANHGWRDEGVGFHAVSK